MRKRIHRRLTGAALVLAAAAAPAAAQEGAVPPADAPAEWTIRIDPAAWYAAPGGRVWMPGTSMTGGGERFKVAALNVDSPRLAPAGAVHYQSGDWRFSVSGFGFSSDDRGSVAPAAAQYGTLSIAAGDPLTSTLDFVSGDATVAYRIFERKMGTRDNGAPKFVPAIDVLGGVRVYDVELSIAGPSDSITAGEFFAEPFAGLGLDMQFVEDVMIEVRSSVGAFSDFGDRSSISWDISAALTWRPTANFGVQVGYRQLAFTLTDGDSPEKFEYSGALAGLYFGGSLKF